MTAPASRPLRRDAQRNRQRILEAARIVFAERGLNGSYDDIAREAGVGVGTVYRRFPDKEELIDALFEERVQEAAQVAREAAEHPDPWQALVGFLVRVQELQSQDRGLKEIVLAGARGAERAAAARSLIAPLAQQLLARAQAAGAVRDDVALTDIPLVQMGVGTIAEAARDVAPDAWRRMLLLVIDGLRADRARTELEPPPLTLEQLDGVMKAYSASRRRG